MSFPKIQCDQKISQFRKNQRMKQKSFCTLFFEVEIHIHHEVRFPEIFEFSVHVTIDFMCWYVDFLVELRVITNDLTILKKVV